MTKFTSILFYDPWVQPWIVKYMDRKLADVT
jgi:hypothetical protein